MGRYFNTDKGEYIDFVYKPNRELELAVSQQQINNDFARKQLLDTPDISINHLDFDKENQTVANIQDELNTDVDYLAERMITDPDNADRYIKQMKTLGDDIKQRKTTGDWYQIEQRYNTYNNWYKENKKRLDKGDISPNDFNRMRQHYWDTMVNDVNTDNTANYNAPQVVGRPEVTQKYMELLNKVKTDSYDASKGMYFYKNEYVSKERLENMVWGQIASDPDFQGYNYQMGQILGDKGYDVSPFIMTYTKDDGTQVEYDASLIDDMSAKEKKSIKRELNPESAYYNDVMKVDGFAYQKQSIRENKVAMQTRDINAKKALQAQKDKAAAERQKRDAQNKKNLAKYKHGLDHPDETLITDPAMIITTTNEVVVTPEDIKNNGKWMGNFIKNKSKFITEYRKSHPATNNVTSDMVDKAANDAYLKTLPFAEASKYHEITSRYEGIIKNDAKTYYKLAYDAGLISKPMSGQVFDDKYWNSQEGQETMDVLVDAIGHTYIPEDDPWYKQMFGLTIAEANAFFNGDDNLTDEGDGKRILSNLDKRYIAQNKFRKGVFAKYKSVSDRDEQWALNLRKTENYFLASPKTSFGQMSLKMLQKIYDSNKPVYYERGLSRFDSHGKLREGQANKAKADVSWWDNETDNPIQAIMEFTGSKNLEELSKYGKISYQIDQGSTFINFAPYNDKLSDLGMDTNDSAWSSSGYTQRYDNRDTKPNRQALVQWGVDNADKLDAETRETFMNMDRSYSITATKCKTIFSQAVNGQNLQSYKTTMPGYDYNFRVTPIPGSNAVTVEYEDKNGNWATPSDLINPNTGNPFQFTSQRDLTLYFYENK